MSDEEINKIQQKMIEVFKEELKRIPILSANEQTLEYLVYRFENDLELSKDPQTLSNFIKEVTPLPDNMIDWVVKRVYEIKENGEGLIGLGDTS